MDARTASRRLLIGSTPRTATYRRPPSGRLVAPSVGQSGYLGDHAAICTKWTAHDARLQGEPRPPGRPAAAPSRLGVRGCGPPRPQRRGRGGQRRWPKRRPELRTFSGRAGAGRAGGRAMGDRERRRFSAGSHPSKPPSKERTQYRVPWEPLGRQATISTSAPSVALATDVAPPSSVSVTLWPLGTRDVHPATHREDRSFDAAWWWAPKRGNESHRCLR
jgi:hypothetical protein